MQLFVNRALFAWIAADAFASARRLVNRARVEQIAAKASAFARHVVDPAHIDRLAAEVFTGPRARFWLMGVLAVALAAAVDPAAAAIWLGAVLLVDATHNVLAAHLPEFSPAQAGAARLGLDIAMNASLAAAPALAWFAPGGVSVALATAMLCLLLSHAAFTAQHGRLHTILACAPYALLGILVALDAINVGAIAPIAACLFCLGYVAAAAMHQVHRASHLRQQDAEWVRQLNMTYGDGVAGWEIDYVRGKLFGGERLSSLLGRPVDYAAIIERGCFATAGDRALVKAAFAPSPGPAHRIAIEHEAVRADGARVRLRHTGFVRTTPDGEPTRLTCVTRLSDVIAEPAASERRVDLRATLGVQGETPKAPDEHAAPLVIVIGDEADARDFYARSLTRAGFAVRGVGSEAGLALTRTESPALVLLDVSPPDPSGWRALQSLKQDAKTHDIPVVVLCPDEDRAHALALGAAEHIGKPAGRDRLAAAVMRYARKRPAPAASPQAAPQAQRHAR